MFPIGIYDIDRKILFHVPDKELYAICIINKYLQQVCDEIFWRNRFVQAFGIDLKQYANKPYMKLYKELINLNNKKLLGISEKRGYLPLIK
jgi:hypothetical protein